jgi:L-threonate 2-dehydrogenase
MSNPVKVAVLGLGEVALQLANGLKNAGAEVIGYDSNKPKYSPIPLAESAAAAVADADIVLSLNSPTASLRTAETSATHLKSGAVFADLNTATPGLKKKLAELVPAGTFVDAAILKASPEGVSGVTLAVSGPGANRFIELLGGYGLNLEFVSEVPGDAAARKLVWSILERGTAALIADTLWAAKSMGQEAWAIEAIKAEFNSSSEQTVQAYLDETGKNPKRGSVEMGDVVEMLAEFGYESTTVNGIALTLSHVMHGRKIPFADLSDD